MHLFRIYSLVIFLVLPCAAFPDPVSSPDAEQVELLHQAIRAEDKAEIEKYRGRPNYLDARNEDGYTALQEAIRWGYDEIIAMLVEFGADPDVPDVNGRTALHHAAYSDELGAAKLLIAKGATVRYKDPYEYTPLHIAAREGRQEIVQVLLNAGADINARCDVGYTAVDLADRFPSVQEYLREQGGKMGHELSE